MDSSSHDNNKRRMSIRMKMKLERALTGILVFGIMLLLTLLIPWMIAHSYYLIVKYYRATTHTPLDYTESLWVCEDPKITIRIPKYNDGTNVEVYVFDNDIPHRLFQSISPEHFCLYDDYEKVIHGGIINKECPMVLAAKTKCYEDRYVLKIKEDHIWGGQYKKIILYRQEEVESEVK